MEKPELALSNQRSKRKSPPSPNPAPWLVIPYGKGEKFQACYNISEPNDTSCRKFIPELKGKSSWQKNSHQDWSIILCDDDEFDYTPWNYGDCFVWNPLSMETINLPSFLYWYTLDGYSFNDCVLYSPPKTDDDARNRNSMVFMLFGGEKVGKDILVYCNPGDKEWRMYMIGGVYELLSMCYFKGKLCIMCNGDEHLEIDIEHGSQPRILCVNKFAVSFDFRHAAIGAICVLDGIFKIDKVFIGRGVYEYCVTNMVISKLDFDSMAWVEVKNLDDHVFFLNRTTRLCCSAKELGFPRGYVYFTQPDEMSFYKYDLEDKSIMLSLPCPDLPNPWFSPNWLMIPTTLRVGGRRRVTEDMLCNKDDGSQVLKAVENRIDLKNDDKKLDYQDARHWVLQNDHMVQLISDYLTPLDYIHFRAVCRNYRSIIPLVNCSRSCSTKCLDATSLSPWMVFSKDNEAVYSFINPMHNNENYLMSIPELLQGSTIRYSKGSWLLMSKGLIGMFFYNPFTKNTIKLLDLPDVDTGYLFQGICFSSLPTSSDCTVFAISSNTMDTVYVSYIKRGDEMWTYSIVASVYSPPNRINMKFEPALNSPIFYNGGFYCLDMNRTLGVFTLENGTEWEVLSMIPRPNLDLIYTSYLVKFEGQLLSVLLGHYGKWVRLFRLDLDEMVWIEVEHLGRHMLFISSTSCIATIAPTSEMENKIYFPRLQNEGILYYSLDSGKYHSLGSEHYSKDYCNSTENLRCSWIEPNWSKTTQSNFDWS
ncbi:hypothetical protein MKW98_020157 [Papaver atlanticum]|uniref:KIB1-4 beta-propeller domain-containing protein n=1 Tax=Papaver atlanticum TaxID=357466 RepID=A0AAD4S973_9MAGN|nr:hypothetical protein MKW98_020157 [Papaver atlanticum]